MFARLIVADCYRQQPELVEVVLMKRWMSGKERKVIVSCPDCFEGNPKKSMIRGQINPAWWGAPEAEMSERCARIMVASRNSPNFKGAKQMMLWKEGRLDGWRGLSSVLSG